MSMSRYSSFIAAALFCVSAPVLMAGMDIADPTKTLDAEYNAYMSEFVPRYKALPSYDMRPHLALFDA